MILIGFIDGTEACPPKNIPTGSLNYAYVAWKNKDVCLLDGYWHLFKKNLFPLFMDWKHLNKSRLPCRLISYLNLVLSFLNLNVDFKVHKPVLVILKTPRILHINWQKLASLSMNKTWYPFFLVAWNHTYHLLPLYNDFTFEDFQAELLGYENLLDVNHSIHSADNIHFWFVATKSKTPTYVKKKVPPLPSTKMQNAGFFNYQSQ